MLPIVHSVPGVDDPETCHAEPSQTTVTIWLTAKASAVVGTKAVRGQLRLPQCHLAHDAADELGIHARVAVRRASRGVTQTQPNEGVARRLLAGETGVVVAVDRIFDGPVAGGVGVQLEAV